MLQLEFRVKRLQQCQMVRNEVVCTFVFTLIVSHCTRHIWLISFFLLLLRSRSLRSMARWWVIDWASFDESSDAIFTFQPRQHCEVSRSRQTELAQPSQPARSLDCQRRWQARQLAMRYMGMPRKLENGMTWTCSWWVSLFRVYYDPFLAAAAAAAQQDPNLRLQVRDKLKFRVTLR
jgi:hypothetical protein